jgi:hypothetical protein
MRVAVQWLNAHNHCVLRGPSPSHASHRKPACVAYSQCGIAKRVAPQDTQMNVVLDG